MVADAKAIQDYLWNRYGAARNCVFLAYGANTVAPDFAMPLTHGLVPGGYLLVVARLEPENQVQEIIEGYLASSCPLVLAVVGGLSPETPYVKRLKALAGDRVRLLGQVYDRTMLNALRVQAFACFHGHTVGGTNPSLLEAIGAGRPIIAHDNAFNREVVGDLACYFLGKGDIPKLLRDVVPVMSADTSLFERSQEWLNLHYSWDKITELYKTEILNDLSLVRSGI
jgi:glycosyltransferase involved in cell wall biosynthesis